MIAVEVRHATLNTHDRSGGPAQNTEHTSSQEEKEKEKKEKEEEKTQIKSNNPHLTGGELLSYGKSVWDICLRSKTHLKEFFHLVGSLHPGCVNPSGH